MKIFDKKQEDGFSVVELLIVAAVLSVIGFGVWKVAGSRQTDNDKRTTAAHAVMPDNLSGLKTIDEILGLAAAEIGARQILAIELQLEDTGLVYSVKLADGSSLAFDARTGGKVQADDHTDPEKDEDKALPAAFRPAVTLESALQSAKEKRPGKTVSKIELEVEDGVVVFSVRFSDRGRVDVDATSGAVLRVREPGKPDIKLHDDDNDIDDDGDKNHTDSDDDNDGIRDNDDPDDEGDGIADHDDNDDDNDGLDDEKDSGGSGGQSDNSGGDSDEH